jgi:hypothetical protein
MFDTIRDRSAPSANGADSPSWQSAFTASNVKENLNLGTLHGRTTCSRLFYRFSALVNR